MTVLKDYEVMEFYYILLKDEFNSFIAADNDRAKQLSPLYWAIFNSLYSACLLISHRRTNDLYIIYRALLERIVNLEFALICSDEEYADFMDYSTSRGIRSMNRVIKSGETKIEVSYQGDFKMTEDMQKAVDKFTGTKGNPKTRWNKLTMQERIERISELHPDHNLSGLAALMMIYDDASEALHGTIYGSVFDLGHTVTPDYIEPERAMSISYKNLLSITFAMAIKVNAMCQIVFKILNFDENKIDALRVHKQEVLSWAKVVLSE
jgi:hypothetical protein